MVAYAAECNTLVTLCLKDTVELREHRWVPRKAFLDNGPKTINQIRQDAVKVSTYVDTHLAVWFNNNH